MSADQDEQVRAARLRARNLGLNETQITSVRHDKTYGPETYTIVFEVEYAFKYNPDGSLYYMPIAYRTTTNTTLYERSDDHNVVWEGHKSGDLGHTWGEWWAFWGFDYDAFPKLVSRDNGGQISVKYEFDLEGGIADPQVWENHPLESKIALTHVATGPTKLQRGGNTTVPIEMRANAPISQIEKGYVVLRAPAGTKFDSSRTTIKGQRGNGVGNWIDDDDVNLVNVRYSDGGTTATVSWTAQLFLYPGEYIRWLPEMQVTTNNAISGKLAYTASGTSHDGTHHSFNLDDVVSVYAD